MATAESAKVDYLTDPRLASVSKDDLAKFLADRGVSVGARANETGLARVRVSPGPGRVKKLGAYFRC